MLCEKSCAAINKENLEQVITTHMLHIPIVVCQSLGQDQWEMTGNCFSEENRISLVQASQRPVKTI